MSIRLVETTQRSRVPSEKERLVANLKLLLTESFTLRRQGCAHSKLSHAQGYADGYMKLMLDTGIVSQKELLKIVMEARRGVDGPATRALDGSPAAAPAAVQSA